MGMVKVGGGVKKLFVNLQGNLSNWMSQKPPIR